MSRARAFSASLARPVALATGALAGIALLSAAPADAQSESAGATADILGRWSFLSDPTYENCSLSGEITFSRGPDEDTYVCAIVANDVCPGTWSYRAEETCVARRDGDHLSIVSRVRQVKPPTGNYLPDDFVLTIIDSGRMTGTLNSALITDAELFRGDAPIG